MCVQSVANVFIRNVITDSFCVQHVVRTKSREKWLVGGITFVDDIPKTASGKILRRVLREWAAAMRSTGGLTERGKHAKL